MATRKPLIVTHMSTVYKVSRAEFVRYLRAIINGKEPDIDEYRFRIVGDIDHQITDLDKQEAKELLSDIGDLGHGNEEKRE